MKMGALVEVTWRDSTTGSAWRALSDHQAVEPKAIKSAGYLSRHDDEAVQIVQSVQQEPDGEVDGSLTIPREAVVSVRAVGSARKRIQG